MDNQTQPNISSFQTQTPTLPSTNWAKVLLFVVFGLTVIAGSVFVGIQIGKNQTIKQQQPITEQPTNNLTQIVTESPASPTMPSPTNTTQSVKFTGIITEINNGCWADGICSIKVDNKWIVAEIGGLRSPNSKPEIRGSLTGINFSQDTNKYIGKSVEVYTKQTDGDNFTIYGNENYYIKLLE